MTTPIAFSLVVLQTTGLSEFGKTHRDTGFQSIHRYCHLGYSSIQNHRLRLPYILGRRQTLMNSATVGQMMNNIWFSSDHHFNHENVIKFSNRPFDNLDEMMECLIERWNDSVKPGDTIYYLGDFALSWGKKHAVLIDSIIEQLHGQKHLIIGNHDRDEVTKNPRWRSVGHYKEIKVDVGEVHKQRIAMSHFAFRSWSQQHRGAWNLFGHSHGNLADIGGKQLDVGVDCWDYRPVGFMELQSIMSRRPIVTCDHHEVNE